MEEEQRRIIRGCYALALIWGTLADKYKTDMARAALAFRKERYYKCLMKVALVSAEDLDLSWPDNEDTAMFSHASEAS